MATISSELEQPNYLSDLKDNPYNLVKEIVYKDEDVEVMAEVGEIVFIHFDYNKLTASKYKKYVKVWEDIQQMFKHRGHRMLFCIIPSRLPLADKAERMFGWELVEDYPPVKLFIKRLED